MYYSKPEYDSVSAYLADRKQQNRGILDGTAELRRIARQCGLKNEQVRGQLRQLGYQLESTANGHGIWRL